MESERRQAHPGTEPEHVSVCRIFLDIQADQCSGGPASIADSCVWYSQSFDCEHPNRLGKCHLAQPEPLWREERVQSACGSHARLRCCDHRAEQPSLVCVHDHHRHAPAELQFGVDVVRNDLGFGRLHLQRRRSRHRVEWSLCHAVVLDNREWYDHADLEYEHGKRYQLSGLLRSTEQRHVSAKPYSFDFCKLFSFCSQCDVYIFSGYDSAICT